MLQTRPFHIAIPDASLLPELRRINDLKTKPLGSLGVLEQLALKIGLIQQTTTPRISRPTVTVYAGDHGLACEGVSPYPAEVTQQMVINFVRGKAAINVFCRQHGLDLMVVDAGVNGDLSPFYDRVLDRKIARGTANMLRSRALTDQQVNEALRAGAAVAEQLAARGVNTMALGEMGIGNSSCAALITSYICDVPVEQTVERGAGCDDATYARKREILRQVADFHGTLTHPWDILSAVGGLEIAMSVGHLLAACERRMLLLIDGFIMSSAALLAATLYPSSLEYMVFCHKSASPAHQLILDHLKVRPLLDLDMRLGEGSGAAVAFPLVASAVAYFNEMASFAEAGVSQVSTEKK